MPDIDVTQVVSVLFVLIASLTVHEAAHAWSADRLGDSTARSLGRVSLNPVVHIDPIGTLLFPLIAFMTSLPVIGWAKPVPVNVRHLSGNWRHKFMLISAAGPVSNLLLAVVASGAMRVVGPSGDLAGGETLVMFLLRTAVVLNVLLAVFNLIPVPPLDGGNVLSGLLRGPAATAYDMIRPYGFLILYALMFTGTLWSIISPPAGFLFAWLL